MYTQTSQTFVVVDSIGAATIGGATGRRDAMTARGVQILVLPIDVGSIGNRVQITVWALDPAPPGGDTGFARAIIVQAQADGGAPSVITIYPGVPDRTTALNNQFFNAVLPPVFEIEALNAGGEDMEARVVASTLP